jgi:hypothetical protein
MPGNPRAPIQLSRNSKDVPSSYTGVVKMNIRGCLHVARAHTSQGDLYVAKREAGGSLVRQP